MVERCAIAAPWFRPPAFEAQWPDKDIVTGRFGKVSDQHGPHVAEVDVHTEPIFQAGVQVNIVVWSRRSHRDLPSPKYLCFIWTVARRVRTVAGYARLLTGRAHLVGGLVRIRQCRRNLRLN